MARKRKNARRTRGGVDRYCKRCHEKRRFVCSGRFRVNANGRVVDVWLIYRCVRCSTSWNAEVYARRKVGRIPDLSDLERNCPSLVEHWSARIERG